MLSTDFGDFVVVRKSDNNTLKIHFFFLNTALNKDGDIRMFTIPVMWQRISVTIPLAKQVHMCKIYACHARLPLLFASLNSKYAFQ